MLAVAPGKMSSYATKEKDKRDAFEADTMLAVAPPDSSSYATEEEIE